MFSSSLLNISGACSSPIVHYYHHHLQESLFQYPSPVAETAVVQEATDHHVPIGCTVTPSIFDESKGMDMVPESADAAPKKKIKKSDTRSKIRTARGLRDRRVRMSMGIARKFFDLQDLLGFDKPSRTLEWLLTKSNKAILELSAAASSSSTSSDHKETTVVKRSGDGYKTLSMCSINNQAGQPSCNAALKTTMKQKEALLARESRSNARARARARTIAKLSSLANLNHQKNRLVNNPEDMMSGDHHTSYFISSSLIKSAGSESHEEDERKPGEDEQSTQNQQLQLQNYDSVIKSYDHWSGLNPSLSLEQQWDVSWVHPLQGSSAAHPQHWDVSWDLSRDFNLNGKAIWDNITEL